MLVYRSVVCRFFRAPSSYFPNEAKKMSKSLQCMVTSHMCGDFLGPCLYTSLETWLGVKAGGDWDVVGSGDVKVGVRRKCQ